LVDANAIAAEVFGPSAIASTNTVMLGALAAATGWFGVESVLKAAGKKFKGPVQAMNERAIQLGYEKTRVVRGGAA
jgi:Pyruvate/2-oxoacid:ferredoxin oxidoreductase gamma subunit